MFKRALSFIIFFLVAFNAICQGTIDKVGKNFIELEISNQAASPKVTINPYFLGNSKLERNRIVFKLFNEKYRFNNDTLFLYLNDTAIIPGIEKYNLGDSVRLLQGFKKYDTLFFQDVSKVKYYFPKKSFSFLVIFYTLKDLAQFDKKSEILFFERKRRKRK